VTEARWSSRAAERFREEVDGNKQVDTLLLQNATTRQEQGPHLWNEVREQVRTKCARLNPELGSAVAMFMVTPESELQVQVTVPDGGHRRLDATFMPTSTYGVLSWSISGHNTNEAHRGEYELGVEQGKAVFRRDKSIVESPEKIAEEMLDPLLLY